MLKNLVYIFLCFTFTYNTLEANSDWNQPKISEDQNKTGHIFKDSRGHFDKDTLENRGFIESATASRDNWVGSNSYGADIYLKTMPDGTQAWAEVWKNRITDGGKNNFPKEWVPDSSNPKGGDFTTPKFTQYNANDTSFHGHLVVNGINSTYQAYSQTPQFSVPLSDRKILGVAGRYGKITNLDFSTKQGKHTILLPTDELTEEEAIEVLRDVAKGIYVYDSLPFFSLHFNHHLTSYPVIHPVYRNTLTGEAIAMLDYYMKGFTTGRSFNEDFVYSWDAHREKDLEFLFSKSFEFRDYCNSLGLDYQSFDEILEGLMGNDSYHGVFTDCFDISYRIIAKQNSITKNGNTISYTPDFEVIGSVEGTPLNDTKEKLYGYLKQACQLMSDQIKETLPKLPICKKHLQVLYLANFFSYYCNTLKEVNKIPMLERQLSQATSKGCPKTFPPVPLSMDNEVQIAFMQLFGMLTDQELKKVFTYLKTKNASDSIIFDAVDVVYDGLCKYFTKIGMATKLTPDQCQDLTVEILSYCKKRYQNVRKNIADVLKSIQVQGTPEDPNTQQRFLRKVDELLPRLNQKERQEMIEFRDKFNRWFVNPLSLCFEESGVMFSVLDGSLKIITNCQDKKAHLSGGCGVAVEDIIAESSIFLGYFHRSGSVNVAYADMESESPEEAREEAKGLLYPPNSEHPFSNEVFQVLQAISHEDVALFDKAKGSIKEWNFKDPYGISFVHHAARTKNPYFLKHMISQGANLLITDDQRLTPLHHAARKGSLECIKLLVQSKPELLEAKALDDETPLFVAIQSCSHASIDLLLNLRANPNCIIINDLSALLWAIQSQNEDTALKLLNQKNIDIHYSLADNNSAIEFSIEMELPRVLKKLIDMNANMNRRAGGYTPLHVAVSLGYLEGVKILLACRDTQINALTSGGDSALALARYHGYQEIEKLLLSYQAH